MPITLTLAHHTFASKKDATEYLQHILYTTPSGHAVAEEHDPVLRALLHLHPRAAQKVGVGLHHFEVGNDPTGLGKLCFHVYRTDGTHCDFSFYKCLQTVKRER